ncbi:hypothetical protein GUJ93_ZPchr0008g11537 [Zizania palustris]|uniref:Uncharacterized protein n=1 Tax=Zizania palustris TaxID=103762 RepID=A0A8J5VHF4_ZIZPA|nr:hypothetical protein GUJ93_ZPchr0008g12677 [Zizania palustris]KAG8047463.1 hypothetical protein GUJ93_ZPchr0008g11537 [Zizania palustris]
MAGSKVLITCILIFVVVSGHTDARRWVEMAMVTATSKGNEAAVAMKGDRSFRAVQEIVYSETKGAMPLTTTDSRPTAPGNSPGIGNKGKINN